MATKELTPQLDVILAAKRQYLQERKAKTPIEAVRALASMQKRPQPVLSSVMQDAPVMLIGQIKYAPDTEPRRGGYDPVASAVKLVKNGADAVALFTDETLYQGGLDDLVLVSRAVSVPVISQDYFLDEYQIVEARAAGASALMLRAGILEPSALRTLVSATQRNRMTAIVEVHNSAELEHALKLSPYVIGIHPRDFRALDGGSGWRIRPLAPPNIRVMVTEGLKTIDEVQAAVSLGVDAVLIDEHLLDDATQVADLHYALRRSHNPF
ncbi:MAG: hypothetical protein K8L97_19330 [Anaerolineae bacterium]|nr:hypothetical protein [Anaerolineae bacterium]